MGQGKCICFYDSPRRFRVLYHVFLLDFFYCASASIILFSPYSLLFLILSGFQQGCKQNANWCLENVPSEQGHSCLLRRIDELYFLCMQHSCSFLVQFYLHLLSIVELDFLLSQTASPQLQTMFFIEADTAMLTPRQKDTPPPPHPPLKLTCHMRCR